MPFWSRWRRADCGSQDDGQDWACWRRKTSELSEFSPTRSLVCYSLACYRWYNKPTPALCRSGYTWPEATIKLNNALDRILR